jgi:hypothetical protein
MEVWMVILNKTRKFLTIALFGGLFMASQAGATYTHFQLGSCVEKPSRTIFQPVVTKQEDGTTCGYRAAAHAAAINTLVNAGLLPRDNRLKQCASTYLKNLGSSQLYADEIINFIRTRCGNFTNYYLVGAYKDEYVSLNSEKNLNMVPDDIRAIIKKGKGALHFICHQGNHWVTFSFVKVAGFKPFFIYTDSLNNSLSPHNACINELYTRCLSAYEALQSNVSGQTNEHALAMPKHKASWLERLYAMVTGMFRG